MFINKLLIGLTAVLFVVATIAFINVLFKQYMGHTFEIGNLSNIITAGTATYTTFIVNNWLRKKKKETGFDNAVSMTKEYLALKNTIQDTYSYLVTLGSSHENYHDTMKLLYNKRQIILNVQSKFQQLYLFGISISAESDINENIEIMINFYEEAITKIINKDAPDRQCYTELKNKKNSIISKIESFNLPIDKLFTFK